MIENVCFSEFYQFQNHYPRLLKCREKKASQVIVGWVGIIFLDEVDLCL